MYQEIYGTFFVYIFDYLSSTPSNYTGRVESFTAPVNGKYKMECWGASGGWAGLNSTPYKQGGKGGYSYGSIILDFSTKLYIVVGGEGTPGNAFLTGYAGGYNGGGKSYGFGNTSNAGGGGATHISKMSGLLSNIQQKQDIIIVAGGGGGAACDEVKAGSIGGYGGGTIGGNGASSPNSDGYLGLGGNQTNGGDSQELSGNYSGKVKPTSGVYGKGGDGATDGGAGGGAGFYGGGGASVWGGAGGGSGYINTSFLTDATMIAGNASMPSPNGGTEVGHTGDGKCIICQVGFLE